MIIEFCAVRSSFLICFSAVRVISIRQAKTPLHLCKGNRWFAALQGSDTLQVVFAVFEILADGLAGIIAFAATGFFGQRFQLFFEFGFEANTEHCLTSLT